MFASHKRISEDMYSRVEVAAAPNIANIKYWGKIDEAKIIPLNDSLSVTLDDHTLCSTTSITIDPSFTVDRLILNGVELPLNNRINACLQAIRELAVGHPDCSSFINWSVLIESTNNFPTAAGLASSASGYACLAFGLAKLYKIEQDISAVARVGSGSACRSVYGGFVKWENVGNESRAVQLFDENHWPELEILIAVASDQQKHTSSTGGMKRSVQTSALLQYRAEHIVPNMMIDMTTAISNKDFPTFGLLTMKDSNQLHAICLDTYPPIIYLNESSKLIIFLITKYNEYYQEVKAAYTFDAGPNAVIFTTTENKDEVESLLKYYFYDEVCTHEVLIEYIGASKIKNGIKDIIHSKVGSGPRVIRIEENLE
eukprot:TRINITY_DN5669_c0_g1_i2.p1 TRINITY_DN5669_c0_g1~~TRINITY_DN5669_c0_g1_i2.p1  ORF type:complete len:371 (-),score=58.22 TRINITY_DN5669_c0_g1_i2:538-1650(-)